MKLERKKRSGIQIFHTSHG